MNLSASADVVYVSPRGKRCVLLPAGRPRLWLEFRYLDRAILAGGGFYLRAELFHRVMRVATPWQSVRAGPRRAVAR